MPMYYAADCATGVYVDGPVGPSKCTIYTVERTY